MKEENQYRSAVATLHAAEAAFGNLPREQVDRALADLGVDVGRIRDTVDEQKRRVKS